MTERRHDLILLKGAPGVGKSSAAKLLASRLGAGVIIEIDALRKMIVSVDWTDQEAHRKVLQLGVGVAADFWRLGFAPVIVVDTFSGDKIDGFLAACLAELPKVRVFVAVLHASELVLERRVLSREEDGFRDAVVSNRINREVVKDPRSFESLIDTSDMTPGDVAEAVVAAMKRRPTRARRRK